MGFATFRCLLCSKLYESAYVREISCYPNELLYLRNHGIAVVASLYIDRQCLLKLNADHKPAVDVAHFVASSLSTSPDRFPIAELSSDPSQPAACTEVFQGPVHSHVVPPPQKRARTQAYPVATPMKTISYSAGPVTPAAVAPLPLDTPSTQHRPSGCQDDSFVENGEGSHAARGRKPTNPFHRVYNMPEYAVSERLTAEIQRFKQFCPMLFESATSFLQRHSLSSTLWNFDFDSLFEVMQWCLPFTFRFHFNRADAVVRTAVHRKTKDLQVVMRRVLSAALSIRSIGNQQELFVWRLLLGLVQYTCSAKAAGVKLAHALGLAACLSNVRCLISKIKKEPSCFPFVREVRSQQFAAVSCTDNSQVRMTVKHMRTDHGDKTLHSSMFGAFAVPCDPAVYHEQSDGVPATPDIWAKMMKEEFAQLFDGNRLVQTA